MNIHVRKNDNVIVVSGNEKGKKGKVLKLFTKKGTVIVEKVNFIKRHLKKGHPQAQQGGIIEKEAPISLSKVMLFCTKCNKPTRIAHKKLADGSKTRICKKCNELI